MNKNLNYEELLNDYKKEDYLYIIESCDGISVSPFEPEFFPCSQCGMIPMVIDEGLAGEILEKNNHNKWLNDYKVGKFNVDYQLLKVKRKINYKSR